uniref:keratin, type I cytoskeletal 18-like n=1 Tax=Pristiophorus japonicus TaxID=55135 RepID=UPI00398EA9B8
MSIHGLRSSSGSSMSSSRRIGGPRYAQSAYSACYSRPATVTRSYNVQSSGRGGSGLGLVYGGSSAGLGLSFGSSLGGSSSFMMLGAGGGGGGITDEKNAMQNLNQRLAAYLNQVQMLEQSNTDLEQQIKEFAGNRTIDGFDWSVYEKTVQPLQQQIHTAILENSHIALEIDNAKLAAEDFKNKWESELMLRQSVENDIDGLHQLKDTYLQLQSNLASDITGLEDEIAYMKKNHDEELKMLRQQKTQDVHVEVDSEPCVDLAATLQQLRDEYTKIVDNNQKDLDNWYKEQMTIKVTETTQANKAVDGAKVEMSEIRRQLQGLDGEYNSITGNLYALQNTLDETDGRYAMQLQQIMSRVSQLEGELGGIRNDLMRQSQSYQNLLNIKMKLEGEIQQYRLLLDGNSQRLSAGSSSSSFSTGGTGKSSGSTSTITTTSTSELRAVSH